jgi:hypothetical protein
MFRNESMPLFIGGKPSALDLWLQKKGAGVLRILTDGPSDINVTLRLDGVVAGRWVDVLRESCEVAINRGTRLTLDLGNVSFVDRGGGLLLRKLEDRQVRLANASPFIADQIRRATP